MVEVTDSGKFVSEQEHEEVQPQDLPISEMGPGKKNKKGKRAR